MVLVRPNFVRKGNWRFKMVRFTGTRCPLINPKRTGKISCECKRRDKTFCCNLKTRKSLNNQISKNLLNRAAKADLTAKKSILKYLLLILKRLNKTRKRLLYQMDNLKCWKEK